jgi:hypothetical protein
MSGNMLTVFNTDELCTEKQCEKIYFGQDSNLCCSTLAWDLSLTSHCLFCQGTLLMDYVA